MELIGETVRVFRRGSSTLGTVILWDDRGVMLKANCDGIKRFYPWSAVESVVFG